MLPSSALPVGSVAIQGHTLLVLSNVDNGDLHGLWIAVPMPKHSTEVDKVNAVGTRFSNCMRSTALSSAAPVKGIVHTNPCKPAKVLSPCH